MTLLAAHNQQTAQLTANNNPIANSKQTLPSSVFVTVFAALTLMLLFISASTYAESNHQIHNNSNEDIHQPWDRLLKQHVMIINDGHSTAVDYQGFSASRALLDRYLDSLAEIPPTEFNRWSRERKMAFLINAYNAYTVSLILDHYPGVKSIKELGSFLSSPWSRKIAPLLGQTRTLDEIEHTLLRGNKTLQDPRIHFAVNCASIGCPALRQEAYSAKKLEQQLHDQAIRFLSDRSRNRITTDQAQVSKIFDWYEEDFESGWRNSHSLGQFLASYGEALGLTSKQSIQLRNGRLDIDFNDYDWDLNDLH